MQRAVDIAENRATLSAKKYQQLYYADSFIRNALPLMIHITDKHRIFILNGPNAGSEHNDVEALILNIGVDEHSRRSASDFFRRRENETAILDIGLNTFEARGLLTTNGNWQALFMPALTHSVDVRGLFHGYKNLLLNLQVLHVIKTVADAKALSPALGKTLADIDQRIEKLRQLARHGALHQSKQRETVEKWINTLSNVAVGQNREVRINGLSETGHLTFDAIPGEMEDTLLELTLNAFAHGARTATIDLVKRNNRLNITLTDDGRGLSDEKRQQIKRVLETERFDPNLTTRKDGSGNGLLAAKKAVMQFPGGAFDVDHGPGGKGTRVFLGFYLPDNP